MNLDKYSNPIFNEQDLFDALYKGYKLNPADIIFVDEPQQFQNLSLIAEHQFFPPIDSSTLTVSDFNHAMQESMMNQAHERNMAVLTALKDIGGKIPLGARSEQ